MNDKKEAFFGDGINLLEKALENSEPENPEVVEEKPVVILVNRHQRRKRAKLARLEAAMEKAEGQRLRAKGKK
jgi:hypothetical protein